MGMIQSSINNLITLAAAGAKLSPEIQEKAELKQLKRKYKLTTERLEESDFNENIYDDALKQQVDLAKEIALREPTKENLKELGMQKELQELESPENRETERQLAELQREGPSQKTLKETRKMREALSEADFDLQKKQMEQKLGRRGGNF